jgi:hypothetical protein
MSGSEQKTVENNTYAIPYFLVCAMISAGVAWLTRNALYSDSVDIGWHYAITNYISQFLSWPPHDSVRPIDNYPVLAHTLATLIGVFAGSNLRAMLLLSVFSTCAIYALLGWGTRRSGFSGWLFALIAGMLMIVFAPSNIFWGNEVITNFFYPQVVGEAGFLGFLLYIASLHRLAFKVIVACGAVVLLDYIFALSAVHLALSCPLLWTVQGMQRWQATRRFPWQTVTLAGMLLAGLSLLVVSNAAFFSMVRNAAFNGGVNVSLGNGGILALIILDGTLFVVLAVLAASNKSRLIHPSFVLAALGGVTAAAFVQWVFFNLLGYGSPYAVAKHAFGLGSLFVVAITTITLDVLATPAKSFWSYFSVKLPVRLSGSPFAGCLFMCLALVSLFWNRPSLSLQNVEMYENDAKHLTKSELGNKILGHTVSFNTQFPAGINFTIAKAILEVRGYSQIEQIQIFFGRLSAEEKAADYFLISPNQAAALDPACEVQTSAPLTVSKLVRASCYHDMKPM